MPPTDLPEEQSVPAGWYPDPRGGGSLFYWDGSEWTGDVQPAAAPPPPAAPSSRDWPRNLVIGGGTAFAVSPFLPWVKVILLGNLTLFQLFSAADRSDALVWVAVLAGGAAAVTAIRNRGPRPIRIAGLLVGVIGGIIAAYALIGLRHDIRDAHGLAALGIGPYISVGGCIAMAIGGFRSKAKPTAPI